jgi:crotonobetainyl-CoA:carnitine CoA-transferase CaiB-like acyl-CoA transferase
MTPAMPLEGLRVLDCTQVMAGPYATLLLADMGAEVIKIEKPSGDDSRKMGPPFINGESAAFLGINRNKKSVVLNLKSKLGQNAFKKIAQEVDVVAENFKPGVMKKLGLGADDLRANHPELIYLSISGFGQTGPYNDRPGYDLLAQGMSGIMSTTGYPDSPPVKVSIPIADLSAGMYAAYGVLSAYIHRLKTGEGQVIDTSLLESAIALTVWESAEYWGSNSVPEPKGSAHRLVAPYQAIASLDGFFNIGIANQANYERFCSAINRQDLLENPDYIDNPSRLIHYQKLTTQIELTTREKTSSEWLQILNAHGVPAGPIYSMDEVFNDPQVVHRQMVKELDHPIAGQIKNLGIPVKLSKTSGSIRMPAPTLGQHTEVVLREFGFPAELIQKIAVDI